MVDVEPNDMAALAHLPTACQWCDPRRPTTHVQSGPRHRRWEFMLLPGERPEDFDDPGSRLVAARAVVHAGGRPLTRAAVYEFRSMLADRMRDGRVLLAGDAAHLTPPFLGQGLCAGPPRRREPGLEARPRAARPRAGRAARHHRGRAPAADGVGDPLRGRARARSSCELDPRPQPPATRPSGPPTRLRRSNSPLAEAVVHRPAPTHPPDPLAGTLSVQGVSRSTSGRAASTTSSAAAGR